MGQRGGGAAFMPDKFVFPGGAVDPEDGLLPGDAPARSPDRAAPRARGAPPELIPSLALAAVRELWEETGLMLGLPDARAPSLAVPPSWRGFYAARPRPEPRGAPLRLPRRHAPRPAAALRRPLLPRRGRGGGRRRPDASGDELAHLQWLTLAGARALPLPFITEVVLSEVEALIADPDPARPVPFFHQTSEGPASACSALDRRGGKR